MQAIHTKFKPDFGKGAQITAKWGKDKLTIPWDYTFGVEENHYKAATALAKKLGWFPDRIHIHLQGQLPDGSYAMCFSPKANFYERNLDGTDNIKS